MGDIMSYMSFSKKTLDDLWQQVENDFPAEPDIDYSSNYQKIELIREIQYTEYRLVVFRGIVTDLEIIDEKYFKFQTKYGMTIVLDVDYFHHGTVNYGEELICEIIYMGGILRVNNLKKGMT